MGLYDRIKRSVMAITGKDPESALDGSLFRYANRKDSLAAVIGTVPFDHFGFQPDAVPPGWGFNAAGKIYPMLRDVGTGTPTVAQSVEVWDASYVTRAPLSVLASGLRGMPENSDPGGNNMVGTSAPNPWQEVQVTLTMTAGAVADGQLLASAGASLKWEIVFLWVKASAAITALTMADIKDDTAAVAPDPGIVSVNPAAANQIYPWVTGGQAMYTGLRVKQATAAKAVTCDLAGGGGTEAITIRMLCRKVA